MYSENNKTSLKETKEDLSKWKDVACSQLNIVNRSALPS